MAYFSAGIMRDLIANRPAASTATQGRLFVATDENKVYRDNGATWDEVIIISTHAAEHQAGGLDELALDTLGAPTDTTDLDASNTAHGLLPKLTDEGKVPVIRSNAIAYEEWVVPFTVIIGGGTSAIQPGTQVDVEIPYAMQLQAWTLLADQAGAVKVDVWVDTYANYPPVDADSICNAHEPEIVASAAKAQDTDLSDWTTVALAAGSTMRLNVDSCTTITRLAVCFKAKRV